MIESTSSAGIVQDAMALTESVDNVSMNKDEFLKLLITQMKNQDPLSPMESQEFAAQLAQFTSVEQLTNINTTLDKNLNLDLILTQAINNTLSVSLIGREVAGLGNAVIFGDDGTARMSFRLSDFAREVNITIYDNGGNVVRTLHEENLTTGRHDISWDGKNDDGEELPAGNYTFEVAATNVDGDMVDAQTMMFGVASGIRYENGSAILVIGGQQIPFSQIIEISQNGQEEEQP